MFELCEFSCLPGPVCSEYIRIFCINFTVAAEPSTCSLLFYHTLSLKMLKLTNLSSPTMLTPLHASIASIKASFNWFSKSVTGILLLFFPPVATQKQFCFFMFITLKSFYNLFQPPVLSHRIPIPYFNFFYYQPCHDTYIQLNPESALI